MLPVEGTYGWALDLAVREIDTEEAWMTKTKTRQGGREWEFL